MYEDYSYPDSDNLHIPNFSITVGRVSWTPCNKPFPDRPYYIDLRVTSDNYLWASVWGYAWTKLAAPQFYLKLYVTENDELIMINQDHGYSLYKSTDKGAHFELKASFHAAFGSSMFHTVYKWRGWYYILIPGHGIQKTTDFEKFTTFWRNEKALDMFFDAYGNIVVLLYDFNGIYYYDNSENQE